MIPDLLAHDWPPERWQHTSALVAVSGGADSIALLRGLATLAETRPCGRLIVAHFHHGLRGWAADADEQFVVATAEALGLECRVGRGDAGQAATEKGDGIEAAAREQRYAFFRCEAETIGARYVVTAHTADDQAETILHRIARGTGLSGLRGMARARALGPAITLLRPLLGVRRAEILAYLDEIGQPFRHDASNDDPCFTRNRIRHSLLPLLAEQYNPQIVEAVLRLGRLAAEAQEIVDAEVAKVESLAARLEADGGLTIDLRALDGCAEPLVREVLIAAWKRRGWPLQALGFDEWTSLAAMRTEAEGAKRMFPGGVLAETRSGQLRLTRGN